MSFPSVQTILDDFNRANATSIGGNWSQLMVTGTKDFGIDSNQCYNPDDDYQAMYYDATTYGPDCETYITIATLQPQTHTIVLYARLQDVTPDTWTFDGYDALHYRWDDGGTDSIYFKIERLDNAVGTQLGAGAVITDHAAGDKFGLRVVGDTITLWYDRGSGYELIMTRTDSTYSNAGYLGLYTDDSTHRIDNFGGGTIVTGDAALSGAGTLLATAYNIVMAAAPLSGSGLLTAASFLIVSGAGELVGTGTLTASGIRMVLSTAALSGTGALSASGLNFTIGTATLSGVGALSATPINIAIAAAALSGLGDLTTTGQITVIVSAALIGVGALSASARTLTPVHAPAFIHPPNARISTPTVEARSSHPPETARAPQAPSIDRTVTVVANNRTTEPT